MCTPSRLLRGRKLIDGVPVALFSMYFFASLSRWKGFFVPINQKHTIKGALIHESVQKNKQTFAPTTRVIAKPRNFWENSEKPSFASCIFGPHYLRHAFRKRSFDLFEQKKKKKDGMQGALCSSTSEPISTKRCLSPIRPMHARRQSTGKSKESRQRE